MFSVVCSAKRQRFSDACKHSSKGFSLVELLVVVAILAIIAAIAIPMFLNQKQKSVHAVAKNDVRTLAMEMKAISVPGTTYSGTAATDVGASGWAASPSAKSNLWWYRVYKNCSADTTGTALSATSQGVVSPGEFVIVGYKSGYGNYRVLYDSQRGQWIENGNAFSIFANMNGVGAPCVSSFEDL